MVEDRIALKGHVRLTAVHKVTGERIVRETDNVICTVGKAYIGDMLIDVDGFDTGFTYCSIGTDDTAVDVADTTLGAETARNVITNKSRAGNVLSLSTYFLSGDSTIAMEETGIHGHSTASAAKDSGILVAHASLVFDNSGGDYNLTIDWDITVG